MSSQEVLFNHVFSVVNFIKKIKIMSALEETTRLIKNEPMLEESAIRNKIRNGVNKSTK